MTNNKDNAFPVIRLNYKKGDLIMKEGDYGLSIYKVIKGKVRIFNESGDREINLATLGPGQVIGEMAFLNRETETRSASVRALEDSELEIWHPDRLSKEYEQMPPIIKRISHQVLERLIRMNELVGDLTDNIQQQKERLTQGEPLESKRLYYRKEVNLQCSYRPVDSSLRVPLMGRIRDISLSGVGLEVRPKNTLNFPHRPGDEFHIKTTLPNGRELDFTAKSVLNKKGSTPGMIFIGMEFTEMSNESRKVLGFFLMP